jgi:hypothetical protein
VVVLLVVVVVVVVVVAEYRGDRGGVRQSSVPGLPVRDRWHGSHGT